MPSDVSNLEIAAPVADSCCLEPSGHRELVHGNDTGGHFALCLALLYVRRACNAVADACKCCGGNGEAVGLVQSAHCVFHLAFSSIEYTILATLTVSSTVRIIILDVLVPSGRVLLMKNSYTQYEWDAL